MIPILTLTLILILTLIVTLILTLLLLLILTLGTARVQGTRGIPSHIHIDGNKIVRNTSLKQI
jgi:hypothetical protein